MIDTLFQVLGGTGFTFFMTALGAALVFFFRGRIHEKMNRAFLGFASGVMMAASVWSLLIPAISQSQELGMIPWLPPAAGFALGGVFLYLVDKTLPWFHADYQGERATANLLVLAVTVHNIPEGMAVGLAFVLAGQHPQSPVYLASAIGLALGIGIQNFPEGAAISLPVRQSGKSAWKSFLTGTMSGVVEPVAGLLAFLAASAAVPLMPWLLSFAAGAMVYVVADELIPQAQPDEASNAGTIGVMAGFLLMMILDVALG
ncbi:ZIP family metal transporter [Lachnospiraceae bacterium 29-84]